eukprot:1319157-Amorphochlora_amoeboformis.AAC.1
MAKTSGINSLLHYMLHTQTYATLHTQTHARYCLVLAHVTYANVQYVDGMFSRGSRVVSSHARSGSLVAQHCSYNRG